jgi:AraC-like DNA-binding protein
MLTEDYLTLRLVHLKPSEEWSNERCRLSFVFPKGGHGQYVSGRVAHRLAPGDLLIASAASEGRMGVLNGGEMAFWCFSVCFENLLPLFASNEICLLQSVIDDFKEAKMYPASSQLASECYRHLSEAPPRGDLGHRSQLLRIVAAVLSLEFKNAHRQRVGFVRVDERLDQVFENLSAAEILSLSVGELAARFSCSRRHLNRLFHQYFGMSVAALRMEMRLLKAISLLRNPDAKIINVAEECGFNHLGLFGTCFRRRFGNSPGQWRKTAENHVASSLSLPPNGLAPLEFNGNSRGARILARRSALACSAA